MEIIHHTQKGKVVVGMSGGVDSSVAAYLLKQEGFEVLGVTMRLWQEPRKAFGLSGSMPAVADSFAGGEDGTDLSDKAFFEESLKDAGRVAEQLGISYHVIDFSKVFHEKVVCNFLEEYLAGRTPNPCIVCNQTIKWEALLQYAKEQDADYLATGHYARIERLPNGRYAVKNSVTAGKDQTYALYRLSQEQLRHTLMPVGEYTKEEVRLMAQGLNLKVSEKPDSMDICFVPDHDYAGFIARNSASVPGEGNFVDAAGTVLGRHRGIIHYTVGQRKGLGIALGYPAFVTQIRPETNEVVLGREAELLKRVVICDNINYMAEYEINEDKLYKAKIRYNHKGAVCRLKKEGDRLAAVFEDPVKGAAPGQALVVYDGEYVVLGGTIL